MTATNEEITTIRVAHSPDSDDAFMFYALTAGKVETEGLTFTHQLTDIETLNHEAKKGTYELTAISYHAYPYVKDKYVLMNVGSSIGDKYGPVLIANEKLSREELMNTVIAVPGELTSAYLALKIWEPELKTEVVPFDQIMDKVRSGEYKAGLIIHEGQVTFKDEGFEKIVDLGEWWFNTVNLPLPLGSNAVRRDLGDEVIQKVARALKRSIEYALEHREEALDYAMQYAGKLDRAKADKFVGMYVNGMTLDADDSIKRAVRLLLYMGNGAGVLPEKVDPEFVDVKEPVSV